MKCLFRYELFALDQEILPRGRMSKTEHEQRNELIRRVFLAHRSATTGVLGVPRLLLDLSERQIDYWNENEIDRDFVEAFHSVLTAWSSCSKEIHDAEQSL